MLSRRHLFTAMSLLIASHKTVAAKQESPRLSTPVAEAVAKAKVFLGERKYSSAISLLEKRQKELGSKLTEAEKQALQVTIADAHFAWGLDLQQQAKWQEAMTHYQAALALDKFHRPADAAADLNNLGVVSSFLGESTKALEFHTQALGLRQVAGDIAGEARTLNNLGKLREDQGDFAKALAAYCQALPLRKAAGDKLGEARTLSSLLALWQQKRFEQQCLPIALTYGKLAGNLYSVSPDGIRGLDRGTAKSPALTIEGMYRLLTEGLLSLGRNHEALQTFERVKAEQYLGLVPQDRKALTERRRELALSPREQVAAQQLAAADGVLRQLGTELIPLAQKNSRTPDEQQRFTQLQEQLARSRESFGKVLETIHLELQKPEARQERVDIVAEVTVLQGAFRVLDPGHVALYTLVSDETLTLWLVTVDALVTKSVPIKKIELQKQIQQLRELLQSPNLDPRPAAQKLYKVLVEPLEPELKNATHVFVALDQSLGTIPYAALYDGTRYLVEKWSTSVLSPVAQVRLETTAIIQKALAVGINEPLPGTTIYPGMAQEIRAIGQSIVTNQDFTQDAWLQAILNDRCDSCHVASTFDLMGGVSEGGLRLGDGKLLTLEQLVYLPGDFLRGMNLLSFSGLQLAPQESERTRGRVESIATLAQRRGAQAVLANVWSVNDGASEALMIEFYRRWKRGVGKAVALRETQLALLRREPLLRENKTVELKLTPQVRSSTPNRTSVPGAPLYPALERRLHPFYWAGFVLFGNSR